MAEVTKPIKVGNYWTNLVDTVTGENANYEQTLTWYDGTPMDDSKADGVIYRKLPSSVGGGYVRKVYPDFGEIFLEKDTVDALRNLNQTEILLLEIGRYKGVTLNGYYSKGDTPVPIQYYLSDTTESDDGGSVFEVGGIKLEHDFVEMVNPSYFGAKGDNSFDNLPVLNNVIAYCLRSKIKSIFFDTGVFLFSDSLTIPLSMSGQGGQFYMKGTGSGTSGTSLRFLSGSLIVLANNQKLESFRVSSITDNGLVIRTTRSYLYDINVMACGKSGIVISDSWIVSLFSCFSRNNSEYGIYLKTGEDTNVSCNCFAVYGGEIQLNGTLEGGYAGVKMEKLRNAGFYQSTIEGNRGHGVILEGQSQNVTFDTCYFEANGKTVDNRDIFIPPHADANNRPNQVVLNNCSHTPRVGHQTYSVEANDVAGLYIRNSNFIGASNFRYLDSMIIVKETVSGRSTGYVDGGSLTYAGYTSMLKNECTHYGKETVLTFSGRGTVCSANEDTEIFDALTVSPDEDGRRINLHCSYLPDLNSSNPVKLLMAMGNFPSLGKDIVSEPTYTSIVGNRTINLVLSGDLSQGSSGFFYFQGRSGGSSEDTYGGNITLLGGKIVYRKGWVRSSSKN